MSDDDYNDEDFIPEERDSSGVALEIEREKLERCIVTEEIRKSEEEPEKHKNHHGKDTTDEEVQKVCPKKGVAPPTQSIEPHPRGKLETSKELELKELKKKLHAFQKANAALRKELDALNTNEGTTKVDSKRQKKLMAIEKIKEENKVLAQLQRTQSKKIKELEYFKLQFPNKHHSLLEEMRQCKETHRIHKDKERAAEEQLQKIQQQVAKFTIKNKTLDTKIRLHDQNHGHQESVIDAAECVMSPLRSAVEPDNNDDVEKVKYDTVVKEYKDQIDACKGEVLRYEELLREKQTLLQTQEAVLKQLKRQLRELVAESHSNEQVCQFLAAQAASVRVGDAPKKKKVTPVRPLQPPKRQYMHKRLSRPKAIAIVEKDNDQADKILHRDIRN